WCLAQLSEKLHPETGGKADYTVRARMATEEVGTIKAMMSGPGQFAENETIEVNVREIHSHVLSKVCMYFTYKVRYTNSSTEIPEFPIAPEIALELLMALNFLDC
ncbi:SKP1 component containing protein, partial [Cricetulus griseus]